MPKIQYALYTFTGEGGGTNPTPYVTDRGTEIENVSSRFALPADISDADAESIIHALGAEPVDGDSSPCAVTYNADWRTVSFKRKNEGGTISLIVPDREANRIVTRAQAVAAIIDGIDGGDRAVQCVSLEGEHFPNLYNLILEEEIPTLPTFALSAPTIASATTYPGLSKVYFQGVMPDYLSDATWNSPFPILVSILSELKTAPPTILTDGDNPWDGCVGDLILIACKPLISARKPRHYTVTLATTGITEETHKIPVKSNDPAEIMDCGVKLVQIASSVCLEYNGESNRLLHTLFT